MELQEITDKLGRLKQQLDMLRKDAALLQLPGCEEDNWFHLLNEKLLPQINLKENFYIAAIVGGTNLGKSSIFNHLAGERLTATTPLASGTKHPFCLIPGKLKTLLTQDNHKVLKELFPGFEFEELFNPDQTLVAGNRDMLYYRFSENMPENLLLLDTPDIDSTDEVNWKRAEKVRRAADVLVSVLTQQRYNDVSVKHFFREVADEDKVVVLIFNMCQLPGDEEYWPRWTATFSQETGVKPQHIYLIPHDRKAVEAGHLNFYARQLPPVKPVSENSSSLMKDLSELKFAEIKVQTIQGALKHLLHAEHGLPGYLDKLKLQTSEYHHAGEILTRGIVTQLGNWPKPPNVKFKEALFTWWSKQQQGWAKSVHGFYNAVGETIIYPFKLWQGPVPDPWEEFRKEEWNYIVNTLSELFKQLRKLSDLENPLLKPRLDQLLSGTSLQQVQQKFQQDLNQVDYKLVLDQIVGDKLKNFRDEAPGYYQMFQVLDQFLAVVKPAASISLFVTGFGPVGHIFLPGVTEGITQTLMHVAGGVGVMAVGEPIVGSVTSGGFQQLLEIFNQIQQNFIVSRSAWLAKELEDRVYGQLVQELQSASTFAKKPCFQELESIISHLNKPLSQGEYSG